MTPALEQFEEGLNTLHLLDKLKVFESDFKKLMCSSESKLTVDSLHSLFVVKFSEAGSNKRVIESKILSFWKDYLLDCQGKFSCVFLHVFNCVFAEAESDVRVEDILCFATATEQIPPLRFQTNPEIQFLHDDDFLWPKANICALILYLPVSYKGSEYDEFKHNMDCAIINGMEFGSA